MMTCNFLASFDTLRMGYSSECRIDVIPYIDWESELEERGILISDWHADRYGCFLDLELRNDCTGVFRCDMDHLRNAVMEIVEAHDGAR